MPTRGSGGFDFTWVLDLEFENWTKQSPSPLAAVDGFQSYSMCLAILKPGNSKLILLGPIVLLHTYVVYTSVFLYACVCVNVCTLIYMYTIYMYTMYMHIHVHEDMHT